MTTQPTVIWTEIPVRNIEAAARFYDHVLGFTTTIDSSTGGAVLNDAMNTVGASLYEGQGKSDAILHFAVPDSPEAAAERVREAGGEVLSDSTEIPVGRFIVARDLDGNKLGLFQGKDG